MLAKNRFTPNQVTLTSIQENGVVVHSLQEIIENPDVYRGVKRKAVLKTLEYFMVESEFNEWKDGLQ